MTKDNKNKPAFPIMESAKTDDKVMTSSYASTGIDERTYIATRAMQGLLSNPNTAPKTFYADAFNVARTAFEYADALLKAREV